MADVEIAERGPLIEVVFDRPQKLNALTTEMTGAVSRAVDELARRPDLRVMLIRAKGRYFSAGSDFVGGGIPDFGGSTMEARRWYRGGVDRESLQSICDKIEVVEKPVVIAHHAPCLGGALELSLSCDFRLAAASARYSLPEVALGYLPGSGGVSRATRLCGPHWARWLVMAGESVDSSEALAIGLVQRVFPDDLFEAGVSAFCEKLASYPAETLALAKLSIDLISELDRTNGRSIERVANSVLFHAKEGRERMQAFRDRRKATQPDLKP